MPADPAAPVTEPRAELVEAAARAFYWQWDLDVDPGDADYCRREIRRPLAAVLPLLTLADLPAARQAEHEQQIRAKTLTDAIEQAHANRRLAWDELDDDEIARHWSGVAGWLRRLARDAAGEPGIDAATWNAADEEDGGVR